MQGKTALLTTLLLTLAAGSSAALAADDQVDRSRDVFVQGTLQGKWQPAASSVSHDQPSVDKSLGVYASMILGKTPRVTAASVSKPHGTELAAQLFTRQFSSN